ncbi:MAG: OmpA family [Proteobacteria bacterium]|nr:OmpA family [Pseudomonadota bacterium]
MTGQRMRAYVSALLLIIAGVMALHTFASRRAASIVRPEYVTGNCTKFLPEAQEIPEIGSLLSLVQPSDCDIHRGTIPAGEILAASGSYLAVSKGSYKPGMGRAANLAMLASATKILASAGWQELATYPGNGNVKELRAEFRRILPDQTRQYFHLQTDDKIKLKMVTLPTPRLNLSLPKPETLASQHPAVADRFSELPPLPGLEYKGLSFGGGEQQYTPADPKLGRPAYTWPAPSWVRTYRSDPAKISASAAARLYSDALRDAGWLVEKDYDLDGYMPNHVNAYMSNHDRELIATLSFSGDETRISLTDIGFQRKVAAIVMQWNLDCVAVIPGLDFANKESALSESMKPALETLLEARQVEHNRYGGKAWTTRATEPVALEIRGRADASGQRAKNLRLAMARAETVKAWLVENHVPPETLSTISFGDLKSDETSEGLPSRTVTVAKLGCSPKKP